MRLRLLLNGAAIASLGSLHLGASHISTTNVIGEYNIWSDGEDHLHIPRKLEEECSIDNMEKFPDGVNPTEVVSFMGMGDTPYFEKDRWCLNHQLRTMENMKGRTGPAFMIHIGDIKSGKPQFPCDRAAYKDVAEIFSNSSNAINYDPKDVLFVPGDNEWSDCEDKDDAWNLWMEHFGPDNRFGFGDLTSGVTVERHTDAFRKPGVDRSENFAFFLNDVLFIGINMVGGIPPDDEALRMRQNLEWIERQFTAHRNIMKGAAIFAHAQPLDGSRARIFGEPLGLFVQQYPDLPIMFFHGNGHTFCTDIPYTNATNFVNVEVDDGDSAPPLKVSLLEHDGKRLWSIDRRGGTYRTRVPEEECPRVEEITWTVEPSPPPSPNVLPPPELTDSPTPMPTVVLPPPKPEFEYLENPFPEFYPLEECQGRCSTNSDCAGGLVCEQVGDRPVPGCVGTAIRGKRYCIDNNFQAPPKPKLAYVTNKKNTAPYPLLICQGDCDDDSQCAAGLYCKERRKGQKVEECWGTPKGGKDYCVPNPLNTLLIVGNGGNPAHHWPLGMCKGDCDGDDDCGPGLRCFKRNGYTAVPGCKGLGVKGKDYCTKLPDPTPMPTMVPGGKPVLKWIAKYPSPLFPLPACKGNCDVDSHCQKGLYCQARRKGDPVSSACAGKPQGGTDYCVPIPTLGPGTKKPYGRCEGYCETTADCQKGLKCKKRSGSGRLPGCKGTGVPGGNYCFDPAANTNKVAT